MRRTTILAALTFAVLSGGVRGAVDEKELGHFRTRISPHVAGVFVEGDYKGTAAMFASHDRAIPLSPGEYDVELLDPRYKPLKARVHIEAGKTSTLRRAMEHLKYDVKGPLGELRTEGFENAAVYLNGRYYANTSELQTVFGRSLLVRPGTYKLEIKPADGTVGRVEEVEIKADMILVVGREKLRSYEE